MEGVDNGFGTMNGEGLGPRKEFSKRRMVENSPKPLKRRKFMKEKPVTASEISTLQETEAIFNSGLFRLQVDELLKEVKLKPAKIEILDTYFETLKCFIMSIKELPKSEVHEQDWLEEGLVKVPFDLDRFVGIRFGFVPPDNIFLGGLSALKVQLKQEPILNITIEIPKAIISKNDYLNQVFPLKKAMYLSYIGYKLLSFEPAPELYFCYNGDRLFPSLVIKPFGITVKVVLDAVPSSGIFKLSRCVLTNNNVRPSWLMPSSDIHSEPLPPSEVYNNSLAYSLAVKSSFAELIEALNPDNLRDAIYLLKVWLRQRQLDWVRGMTDSILLNLILYLVKQGKVNGLMSSYQIVRVTWHYLSTTDWSTKGISLAATPIPSMEIYHSHYPVVFVDTSGYVNLCANMAQATYRRVQFEAKCAMTFLDDPFSNSFNALFLDSVLFIHKFDYILHLKQADLSGLKEGHENLCIRHGSLDVDGISLVPGILGYLRKAFTDRVVLMDFVDNRPYKWSVTEDPPSLDLDCTVGLLLDPSNFLRHIDKGPEANSDMAEEFISFWKDKCSLRRYPDGTICHSVVWSSPSIAHKRSICEKIARWTLENHCSLTLDSVSVFYDQYLRFIHYPYREVKDEEASLLSLHCGTGEEAFVKVTRSLDTLRQRLRNLSLELTITSVQGLSPSFRYTELLPPLPVRHVRSKSVVIRNKICVLKDDPKVCPRWVEPLEVVVNMEASGSWPDDVEAIKRLKAAFYIKMSALLRKEFNMLSVPTAHWLEVLLDGFVFRIRIAYYRELILMKKVVRPDGMVAYRDNEESLEFQKQFEDLPKINSTLHGLQLSYNSFGAACRLVKRWISSQLLSNHFSDVAVELIVAHLYLHPAPFSTPSLPQVAFVRFLNLMSRFDWISSPLLVNLNGDLQRSEVKEVERKFLSSRDTLCPLHIVTPFDYHNSFWTKEGPSKVVLSRVSKLAKTALDCTTLHSGGADSNDFGEIFRPSYSPYDVIIKLKPTMIPRRFQNIDYKPRPCPYSAFDGTTDFIPVAGFCPVEFYVKELMHAYGKFALFFWDRHGGDTVSLVWKPGVCQGPQEFMISHVNCMMPVTRNDKVYLEFNLAGVLQDFRIVGEGLVVKVTNNKSIR